MKLSLISTVAIMTGCAVAQMKTVTRAAVPAQPTTDAVSYTNGTITGRDAIYPYESPWKQICHEDAETALKKWRWSCDISWVQKLFAWYGCWGDAPSVERCCQGPDNTGKKTFAPYSCNTMFPGSWPKDEQEGSACRGEACKMRWPGDCTVSNERNDPMWCLCKFPHCETHKEHHSGEVFQGEY